MEPASRHIRRRTCGTLAVMTPHTHDYESDGNATFLNHRY
jgi:hypothetical protein